MPGRNEVVLDRMVALVASACVRASVETIQLIHEGATNGLGASPGIPVDSGRARAGGRVGLNGLPSDQPPPTGPFPVLNLNGVRAAFAGAQVGDVFVWTNTTKSLGPNPFPYPQRLEEGYSKQAPNGFLRLAADEAKRIVENTDYTRLALEIA